MGHECSSRRIPRANMPATLPGVMLPGMKTAFPVSDPPAFATRLAPFCAAVGMLTCAVLLPTVHADSNHRSPRTAVQWTGLHTQVLDANHLAMWVSNVGS